ncbi:unnamed protein product, partial [Staurois parvus]
MRGDQRVKCVQGVFYWGGGVLHCNHTTLDGQFPPTLKRHADADRGWI